LRKHDLRYMQYFHKFRTININIFISNIINIASACFVLIMFMFLTFWRNNWFNFLWLATNEYKYKEIFELIIVFIMSFINVDLLLHNYGSYFYDVVCQKSTNVTQKPHV